MNHYESLLLKFWKKVVWNPPINPRLEYLAFTSQVYCSRTTDDMKIVQGIRSFSKKEKFFIYTEKVLDIFCFKSFFDKNLFSKLRKK